MAEELNVQMQNPAPEVPQKKKSGALKWVLIGGCGCILVIAIFFGLIFGGVFWGFKKVNAMVNPTIKAHAQAIIEGDIDKAYSYCSDEFKAATDRQSYQVFVETYKDILISPDYKFNKFNMQNNMLRLDGSVTTQDGNYYPITYIFIKKGGKWYIYTINIGG